MRSTPTIRACVSEDAEALAHFGEHTFWGAYGELMDRMELGAYISEAFALDRIETELADPRCHFYVAELAEQTVGYAKIRVAASPEGINPSADIELERIYADPGFYGKGIGRALMQTCLDEARALGHSAIWLGVWERNQRAISFYEKWDFAAVGDQTFVVGSDVQRDIVFRRPL